MELNSVDFATVGSLGSRLLPVCKPWRCAGSCERTVTVIGAGAALLTLPTVALIASVVAPPAPQATTQPSRTNQPVSAEHIPEVALLQNPSQQSNANSYLFKRSIDHSTAS